MTALIDINNLVHWSGEHDKVKRGKDKKNLLFKKHSRALEKHSAQLLILESKYHNEKSSTTRLQLLDQLDTFTQEHVPLVVAFLKAQDQYFIAASRQETLLNQMKEMIDYNHNLGLVVNTLTLIIKALTEKCNIVGEKIAKQLYNEKINIKEFEQSYQKLVNRMVYDQGSGGGVNNKKDEMIISSGSGSGGGDDDIDMDSMNQPTHTQRTLTPPTFIISSSDLLSHTSPYKNPLSTSLTSLIPLPGSGSVSIPVPIPIISSAPPPPIYVKPTPLPSSSTVGPLSTFVPMSQVPFGQQQQQPWLNQQPLMMMGGGQYQVQPPGYFNHGNGFLPLPLPLPQLPLIDLKAAKSEYNIAFAKFPTRSRIPLSSSNKIPQYDPVPVNYPGLVISQTRLTGYISDVEVLPCSIWPHLVLDKTNSLFRVVIEELCIALAPPPAPRIMPYDDNAVSQALSGFIQNHPFNSTTIQDSYLKILFANHTTQAIKNISHRLTKIHCVRKVKYYFSQLAGVGLISPNETPIISETTPWQPLETLTQNLMVYYANVTNHPPLSNDQKTWLNCLQNTVHMVTNLLAEEAAVAGAVAGAVQHPSCDLILYWPIYPHKSMVCTKFVLDDLETHGDHLSESMHEYEQFLPSIMNDWCHSPFLTENSYTNIEPLYEMWLSMYFDRIFPIKKCLLGKAIKSTPPWPHVGSSSLASSSSSAPDAINKEKVLELWCSETKAGYYTQFYSLTPTKKHGDKIQQFIVNANKVVTTLYELILSHTMILHEEDIDRNAPRTLPPYELLCSEAKLKAKQACHCPGVMEPPDIAMPIHTSEDHCCLWCKSVFINHNQHYGKKSTRKGPKKKATVGTVYLAYGHCICHSLRICLKCLILRWVFWRARHLLHILKDDEHKGQRWTEYNVDKLSDHDFSFPCHECKQPINLNILMPVIISSPPPPSG